MTADPDDPLARAAAAFADRAALPPDAVVAATEAAARRFETPCGDGAMVWRVFGAGPPLALLHGGHGSWTHWLPAIPALARRRRVLAADMPGFGDSAALVGAPTVGGPAAEAVAAPVTAGLAALLAPGETVALAGFSFGGVIAGRVARRLGDRASGVVFVGAPGFGLPIVERPPTRPIREARTEAEREAAHRANLAAMMIAEPDRIDALALHLQALNVARARTPSRPISRTAALRDVLPEIRARIGALYGARDVVAPQHAARDALLRAIQPEARQIVIPRAGHWVMWEAPEATVAALEALLGDA